MNKSIDLSRMSEPQKRFMTARARHICYGGARGGGKSWAMRKKFVLLALNYPGIQILLMRRTLPELRANHINPLLAELNGVARYKSTERCFEFPNGSRISMGYCDKEKDVYRYQGHEYDVIGLEEATHFTEEMKNFMTTCNRSVRLDFTPRMYYTCNPGNVGHAWVKRLFVDRQFKPMENPDDYVFIPAKVYDNRVLMEANPEYEHTLMALPEDLRRAFLYGDWDVFAGQYFSEFRRETHTCEPFPIPEHWTRFRAIDYGLDMLACVWAACDELGNTYIYRELCKPNLTISDAAAEILQNTAQNERIMCTYAPHDMWGRNRATGKTQAEMFAAAGLVMTPVRNGRVDGWANLKEQMRCVDDGTGEKKPKLHIFRSCTKLIHDIPQLQHDKHNPSDAATEPHEITHAPDALRYLFDGRPRLVPAIPREANEESIRNFLDYGG